jgi:hypothetical protein
VLDLMVLVAAVAMTLISPVVMKAIIPADSHHNWDRRQYVAHLAVLILIWWTAAPVALVLAEGRSRLRQACLNYGVAAVLASMVAALILFARQLPAILLIMATGAMNPIGLFFPRLFDVMEHAPDSSAAAVLAAWSLLAMSGLGTRPSNWFERLCGLVGLTWILIGLLVVPLIWYAPIQWLRTSGITW